MASRQSGKMIGRLKRMAASDKNKDYLDQVYYAMGNIYLSQRDTTKAIAAYERGGAKSTRNGVEKGVLMLRLGNLYWDRERFADAQCCYTQAIGMLDKDRKDYAQLTERSKVLDALVPYTSQRCHRPRHHGFEKERKGGEARTGSAGCLQPTVRRQ